MGIALNRARLLEALALVASFGVGLRVQRKTERGHTTTSVHAGDQRRGAFVSISADAEGITLDWCDESGSDLTVWTSQTINTTCRDDQISAVRVPLQSLQRYVASLSTELVYATNVATNGHGLRLAPPGGKGHITLNQIGEPFSRHPLPPSWAVELPAPSRDEFAGHLRACARVADDERYGVFLHTLGDRLGVLGIDGTFAAWGNEAAQVSEPLDLGLPRATAKHLAEVLAAVPGSSWRFAEHTAYLVAEGRAPGMRVTAHLRTLNNTRPDLSAVTSRERPHTLTFDREGLLLGVKLAAPIFDASWGAAIGRGVVLVSGEEHVFAVAEGSGDQLGRHRVAPAAAWKGSVQLSERQLKAALGELSSEQVRLDLGVDSNQHAVHLRPVGSDNRGYYFAPMNRAAA